MAAGPDISSLSHAQKDALIVLLTWQVAILTARIAELEAKLDAAPARGAVEELLEAAHLAVSRRGLKARLRAGLKDFNVPAQCRGRRNAENIIEPVGPTPVENLGSAMMTVAAQLDLRFGQ